jgi:hypothetical protein
MNPTTTTTTTTTVDIIFFFPEVWDEVGEVLLAKDRKTKLGEACKKLAARDKRPQQRATVPSLRSQTSFSFRCEGGRRNSLNKEGSKGFRGSI